MDQVGCCVDVCLVFWLYNFVGFQQDLSLDPSLNMQDGQVTTAYFVVSLADTVIQLYQIVCDHFLRLSYVQVVGQRRIFMFALHKLIGNHYIFPYKRHNSIILKDDKQIFNSFSTRGVTTEATPLQ